MSVSSRLLCRGYDLALRSEFAVPGAPPLPSTGDGPVDVEISRGEAFLESPTRTRGPFSTDGHALLIDMGNARFLCLRGERVVVEPQADAGPEEVAALLAAVALPALLWMRGDVVLHASAAILPGQSRAAVVLGKSGAGKSVVARAMLAIGARIVADDTVRLWRRTDGLFVSGLPGLLSPRAGESANGEARERLWTTPAEQASSAALGDVYVLQPAIDGPARIRRLSAGAALGALLANRHRPRAPHLLGLTRSLLPVWVDVAARISAFSWARRAGELVLTDAEKRDLDVGHSPGPGT